MGVLRFILAVSVVLFHTDPYGFQLVGGGLAVESFFIISGFYMSLVLDKKYTGVNGRYSLFIGNRLLKLYPAYWTVLVLAVLMQLLVWLCTGEPFLLIYQIMHFKMNLPGILFLGFSNIAILGQDWVSFMGLDKASGDLFFTADFMKTYPFLFSFLVVPQGWSLGIELCFYLVAPFLLRKKLFFILTLMALTVILRIYLVQVQGLHYDPWIFRFFPSQLLLFLAGNLSYRVYTAIKTRIQLSKAGVYCILFFTTAITIAYSAIPFFALKKEIYLVLICLVLPLLVNAHKFFRFDTFLGELSYPVYLSHMLALNIVGVLASKTGFVRTATGVASTILLTLLLSMLVNRFVVQPIDRYRQSRLYPDGK